MNSEPHKKSIAPVPRITLQAFWEEPATQALLKSVTEDPRMSRVQIEMFAGGLSAALEAYQASATPNLIIIESKANRRDMLVQLDSLAEFCDATTKVIALGDVNDVQLYRDLMARGISDYLITPFEPADLVRAIAHLYADPMQRLVGRVIAVSGVKGGCGASTLAHNLAVTIARGLRQPTILMDLDLPFGTAALDFNQEPQATLADAIAAGDRVDSVFVERLLISSEEHVSLLAAPALVEGSKDMPADALDPILDAARSLAPFIILDLPHGWPEWKRRAILSADDVIFISEPDLASLRNAKNIIDFARVARPQDLEPRLVLNKVGMARRPEIAASDFEKALAIAPVAIIPHDAKIFGTAANNGQALADTEGSAKIEDQLRAIANKVAGVFGPQQTQLPVIGPLVERLRSAFA